MFPPVPYETTFNKCRMVVTERVASLGNATKSDVESVRELLVLTRGLISLAEQPSMSEKAMNVAESLHEKVQSAYDRIQGLSEKRANRPGADLSASRPSQGYQPVPEELSLRESNRVVSGGLPGLGKR